MSERETSNVEVVEVLKRAIGWEPRLCACGCGKSLEGKNSHARYYNKTCHNRAADPVKKAIYRRRHTLKQKYGMTLEEWQRLFDSQGHACAACRTLSPGSYNGWHVDHDHETGRVRGILCHGCNVALGHLGDDPQRVGALLKYLER